MSSTWPPKYRDARYFYRGRHLYGLQQVLANNRYQRFKGRPTSRRPLGRQGEPWPRYALAEIHRSGHQHRLQRACFELMLTGMGRRLRAERLRKRRLRQKFAGGRPTAG